MRILVVEDEPALASAVRQGLEDERYVVDVAVDGETALAAARGGGHDLVVLDVLLPGLSGLEICRRLRAARRDVPILMLTARDATRDVVAGLDAGANDYLTKPFAFDELLARVRALLRTRTRALAARVRVGGLVVDTTAHRAFGEGGEVPLGALEYRLLEYLAVHQGEVVPKDRLARALWPDHAAPDSNALEVHVASLRRKLSPTRGVAITMSRGAGYCLRVDVP